MSTSLKNPKYVSPPSKSMTAFFPSEWITRAGPLGTGAYSFAG